MPIPLIVSFLSINIVRAAVNRLNSKGARTHPCRTPVRVENDSVSSPVQTLHNGLYGCYVIVYKCLWYTQSKYDFP